MMGLGSRVLYLHGRGEKPEHPPGDLVLAHPWRLSLFAPDLAPGWFTSLFSDQVEAVEKWLEGSAIAIGHSWGAWLLLCAAHQRSMHGHRYPPLLLLSAVLGVGGKDGREGLGLIAPRSRTIRHALGLDKGQEEERPMPLEPRLIRFVHGEDDGQCPVVPLQQLRALGFSVNLVPGGHRLEHPGARLVLVEALQELESTHRRFKRVSDVR